MKTLGLIIIFICMVLPGCDIFESNLTDQKYLFDVYYVNNAWGFVLHGTYIDNNGNVFSYHLAPVDHVNYDSIRVFSRHGVDVKEEDLYRKYQYNKKFIRNIDPSVIREKLVEIYRVPINTYSDTLGVGADMGANVYSCYQYNEHNGTYHEVELKVTGDLEYHNTSRQAAKLVEWLDSQLKDSTLNK